MIRNFQSIFLILALISGLTAQGNVLQINSPSTGELISTSSCQLITALQLILILVILRAPIAMVLFV